MRTAARLRTRTPHRVGNISVESKGAVSRLAIFYCFISTVLGYHAVKRFVFVNCTHVLFYFILFIFY